MWPVATTKRLLDTSADDARYESDDNVPMAQEPSSGETFEPVSALQQAHEMSHRPESTAESFFQAHKDMTVTSMEQARQKQLEFLESKKVFEEVYGTSCLLEHTSCLAAGWTR